MLTGILSDYNIYMHIASDGPIDFQFLHGRHINMQSHLDGLTITLQNWTHLNALTCSFLERVDFVTRLSIGHSKIDKKSATTLLGYWVDEEAGKWGSNTKELFKSAYSRISMLTKLEYTGVKTQDLIEIYLIIFCGGGGRGLGYM